MFLIIDGNNLAWAGYYGLERAMKPDDDERRARVAMLGLGGMVLGAIARAGEPPGVLATHQLTRVAVCFDDGRPLRRRKIFPPYQGGRERDPKFITNEPTILAAIQQFIDMATAALPIEIVRGKNTEADDLIAGLIHAAPNTPKRVVSSDRDFLQLIGPAMSIYSPIKKVVIDETNFAESTAPKSSSGELTPVPMTRFLDYRALVGDPSDDLPGVPGLGPLSAAKLLASAPLDTYLDYPTGVRAALERKSVAIETAFQDGTTAEIVERNRELMDLRRPAPCWDDLGALTKRGTWQRSKFESWMAEQRFSGVDEPLLFDRLTFLSDPIGTPPVTSRVTAPRLL